MGIQLEQHQQQAVTMIEEWFKKIGEKLPQEMGVEFEKLKGGVK